MNYFLVAARTALSNSRQAATEDSECIITRTLADELGYMANLSRWQSWIAFKNFTLAWIDFDFLNRYVRFLSEEVRVQSASVREIIVHSLSFLFKFRAVWLQLLRELDICL